MKTNAIGLDQEKTVALAKELNILLANYSIFYQNVRGYHWNIKGKQFFELHAKFEELYNDLLLKIDEIAERILALGEKPAHNYSNYIEVAKIKESKATSDGKVAMEHILDSFKNTISIQREILTLAAEASDEGTNSLMSDYIQDQEKLVWMYSAYLD